MALFQPGQKIGAYHIVRLLGQGGMGAVYEVEHEQLGVRYALKAFTLDHGYVDVLKKKFLAEGKVLARLRDPHIIRVFDLAIDEATGVPYFVMDIITYKDGTPHTLDDVEIGDLEEDFIRVWFEDLCAALDYIHSQGIVHRDIKLGNVLLKPDKHVVLSDFGVSRIFGDNMTREINVTKTMVTDGQTETKLIMGTTGYMAPEVVRGEDATPAADAYSLGVMFVYLLTGIWYEPGSKALELLDSFTYRWKPILSRMLANDPALRPQVLSELPRQLIPPPSDSQTVPLVSSRRRVLTKRNALIAAGVAGLVALVGLVGLLAFSEPDGIPPQEDDFAILFSCNGIFEIGNVG